MNFELIKENKKAIWFLVVFVGLYLILNTAYGFYINYYYPTSDPFTRSVTSQVGGLLSIFDSSVTSYPSSVTKFIAITKSSQTVVNVFEGCNGLNVMIVYVCFLFAFKGPTNLLLKFLAAGILGIHLMNLVRVSALYLVALYFRDQLYFFHKYLFTGILYLIVFVLWFYWVRKVKNG